MQERFFFVAVFIEGVASFLSPCVIPLIPAYLAYMTGQSVESVIKSRKVNKAVVWNSLGFILGFSIIFVVLGAVATSLGKFLLKYQDVIRKISGILIILFGLFQAGAVNIPFLNYEKRLQIVPKLPGFIASVLVGMGFSFGWTPCIGPVLSSVLIMASQLKTLVAGVSLLAVYSIGMGLPFFILAIASSVVWERLEGLYRHLKTIKVVSGILLIVVGIMIYFNRLALFGEF